ncbi:MAG: hypothetical protein ACXW18_05860, partial [Pyrinomonadaceae bacterium]
IVVGLLVSVANMTGALNAVPWLSARIPTLTLLLVSLVMAYLVIERGNKLDTIESLVRRVSHAPDIQVFETRKDFFDYATGQIQRAAQIDVSHFGLSAPSPDDPDSLIYYQTFARVILEGRIRVRRILIIRNKEHIDWASQMLSDFAACPRFFLSVYLPSSVYIPMINLMVVDSTDVYIGGGERSPSDDPKALRVTHRGFTNSVQEHFRTLWREAVPIKSVNDLETLLRESGPR